MGMFFLGVIAGLFLLVGWVVLYLVKKRRINK
jgi:hypothetical protein